VAEAVDVHIEQTGALSFTDNWHSD
jgi:hypothetical protein